jgi:hypothetical protein
MMPAYEMERIFIGFCRTPMLKKLGGLNPAVSQRLKFLEVLGDML